MKTLRSILTLLVTALLVGVVSWQVIQLQKNKKCADAEASMFGVKMCLETPGCFYTADNIVDAKLGFMYHQAHCKP